MGNYIITVVIADDHEIFRDGLQMMLGKIPDIKVVDEACNGLQLVNSVKEHRPDIVITDIIMPVMDGIAAAKNIHASFPETGIIALSMFDEEHYIVDMLESGAMGYLLKNADKTEIADAIKTVYVQNPYYCKLTSARLTRIISSSKFNPYTRINIPAFTDKEKEVIKLICSEHTNREIGELLFMSTRTVEGYRARIQEKMKVKSTAGIVIFALKTGLYKFPS
ncbi:MAG TPA: response regulator transcription factor [Chitinophagaceae bacterium]|nr:response regulator transcription factor [Chitinophagaceae bacterium]